MTSFRPPIFRSDLLGVVVGSDAATVVCRRPHDRRADAAEVPLEALLDGDAHEGVNGALGCVGGAHTPASPQQQWVGALQGRGNAPCTAATGPAPLGARPPGGGL